MKSKLILFVCMILTCSVIAKGGKDSGGMGSEAESANSPSLQVPVTSEETQNEIKDAITAKWQEMKSSKKERIQSKIDKIKAKSVEKANYSYESRAWAFIAVGVLALVVALIMSLLALSNVGLITGLLSIIGVICIAIGVLMLLSK